jgi:hypothetical protein
MGPEVGVKGMADLFWDLRRVLLAGSLVHHRLAGPRFAQLSLKKLAQMFHRLCKPKPAGFKNRLEGGWRVPGKSHFRQLCELLLIGSCRAVIASG